MRIKKNKVQILLDKNNNWMEKYFNNFKLSKNLDKKFDLSISFKIKREKFDLLFILGYTKKINLKKLNNYKKKFIIHESNLPKGRGFSPIKNQILKKIYKIKCCLIECVEKIDAGDIYESDYIIIENNDLYDDIRIKQFKLTIKLIEKLLKKYPKIKGEKQIGKPTYYKRFDEKSDEININKNISSLFDLLRSTDYTKHQNYFFMNGEKYFIRISKKKI